METETQKNNGNIVPLDLTQMLNVNQEQLTAVVEFKEGILLHMSYISRVKLQQLYKTCTEMRYDTTKKARVPQVDQKKFSEEFCRLAVTGWGGVTYDSLSKVLPLNRVDPSRRKESIPFSHEQLFALVQAAYELDTFIQDMAVDARVFSPDLEDELKN